MRDIATLPLSPAASGREGRGPTCQGGPRVRGGRLLERCAAQRSKLAVAATAQAAATSPNASPLTRRERYGDEANDRMQLVSGRACGTTPSESDAVRKRGTTMAMNTQGRPTHGASTDVRHRDLLRPSRPRPRGGVDLRDRRGNDSKTGVDLPEPKTAQSRLGGLERRPPIGLPGLTEPETMRHYVRLQPQELRDRQRALSARLVHDEAQPPAQREDGAAARLRRHPPAAAAVDRAGRHRS